MDTRILTHAIAANQLAYWQTFAQLMETEYHDDGDCVWFVSGLSDSLFNGVLRAQFTDEVADQRIAKLLDYFRTRRLPMRWSLEAVSQPPDLRERLLMHGLRAGHTYPWLTLSLAQWDDAAWSYSSALTVEPVTTKMFAEQDYVMRVGFGMDDACANVFREFFRRAGMNNEHGTRHFLVRLNGQPIGKSQLFCAGGIAAVYNVATLPAARGRGAATLAIRAALQQARDDGYALGALGATEAGYPLYRKMGFADCCTLSDCVW